MIIFQSHKTLLSVLFFIAFQYNCISQPFQKLYGLASSDEIRNIVLLSNGDYIVSGTTSSVGAGGSDVYIARVDQTGTVIWQKAIGGTKNEIAGASILNSNGNVLLGGSSNSFNNGSTIDLFLLEIDANGNIQWARTFGTNTYEETVVKMELSANGILICGNSYSPGSNAPDFIAMEVNTDGSVINWQNRIGDSGSGQIAGNLKQSSAGGYVFVGGSYVAGNLYDQVVLRLDDSGRIINVLQYGSSDNENAESFFEDANNDIVVMGNFRVLSGSGLEAALVKVKSDLSAIVSSTLYGDKGVNNERTYSFIKTSDGGYALAGVSYSSGNGDMDIILIKTDAAGNLLWANGYGEKGNDQSLNGLVQNSDDSFTIVGQSNSAGEGVTDGIIFRTDALGNVQDNCFKGNIVETKVNPTVRSGITFAEINPSYTSVPVTPAVTSTVFGESIFPTCFISPVTLLSFDTYYLNDEIVVDWETAMEKGNSHFNIQRSVDGVHFENIGRVDAVGTSSSRKHYSFTDKSPNYGKNYYRLQQVDIDGSSTFFQKKLVENVSLKILIFPNPSDGMFHLKSESTAIESIEVLDCLGQTILTKKGNGFETSIVDLTEQKDGVYFVRITSESKSIIQKLIKK